jgi:hypothetical protein
VAAAKVRAAAGRRSTPFVAGVGAFLLAAVYPMAAAVRGSWCPLALLLALRTAAALLFRKRWTAVALHPMGAVLALGIAIESFIIRRTVEWRGRRVVVPGLGRGE